MGVWRLARKELLTGHSSLSSVIKLRHSVPTNVELPRSSMVCSACGCQMSWSVDASVKDGFRWRCRKKTSLSRSFIEVLLLTWRHVKAFLTKYNRKGEYTIYLARYMFTARCRSENMYHFEKFLDILATTVWSVSPPRDNDGATDELWCHVIRWWPTSATLYVAAHHRLAFASTNTDDVSGVSSDT